MEFLTPSIRSLLINGCLILLALTLVYSILIMVGGTKIFEKAKKNKTTVYFPILNLFAVLEIVDMSSFFGILFFIPVFNILSMSIMFYKLGNVFNTSFKFKIGLVLFPLCFYPLLAYGEYKYKISDEEYFKALDDAKPENINLLTDEEIKEQNTVSEEKTEVNVDSIFKSDAVLREKVGPYKAQKVDNPEPKALEDELAVNPFKPIDIVKPPEQIKEDATETEEKQNKFIESEKKKDSVEYVDL